MTPGDQLRFVIDDFDDQGDGVGRAAAVEIHVAGTLPGEEITAQVDNISSHRPVAWATLRTIHRPSPHRVQAACPAQGRCGGCVMQHCAVAAQVAWKDAWLRRRVAAHPALATTTVAAVVPSPSALPIETTPSWSPGARSPQVRPVRSG